MQAATSIASAAQGADYKAPRNASGQPDLQAEPAQPG